MKFDLYFIHRNKTSEKATYPRNTREAESVSVNYRLNCGPEKIGLTICEFCNTFGLRLVAVTIKYIHNDMVSEHTPWL